MKTTTSAVGRITALLLALLVAGGCADSTREEATGKGRIRGINAVDTAPELTFRIEERNIDNVSFKQTTAFSTFDDLSYNFNFDLFLPGAAEATRVATTFIDVVADNDYTVVLTGSIANPSIVVWEDPISELADTATVFEFMIGHLSSSLGTVDVYLAEAGTVPMAGNAVATLSRGERLPLTEFASGIDYELILTPPNDPLTELFHSDAFQVAAASRAMVGLFDADPSITAQVGVNLISSDGLTAALGDVNFPPQLRLIHSSIANANIDAYVDMDFNNAVFSDVAFGELTNYIDIPIGTPDFSITQTGNPGMIFNENVLVITPNLKRTLHFGGAAGSEFFRIVVDEARPLSTFPVMRILNMSVNTDFVNVYIEEPGTEITDETLPAFFGLGTQADTGFFGPDAGTLEITITATDDVTPIAPPVSVDLANGDATDYVIHDTVDPNVLELRLVERF